MRGGGIGAFLSRDGLREWYPKLEKPSFTPPGSDLGPAWGLLYALMGGRNKTQKEPAPAAVHRRG